MRIGVSACTIKRIMYGRLWTHVTAGLIAPSKSPKDLQPELFQAMAVSHV